MKKAVVTVLAIVLMVFLVCSVSGEGNNNEYVSNGFIYTVLEDGTAQISGYNAGSLAVVIPAELDGRIVSSIGTSAFAWSSITSVEIADSIVNIGNSAFAWCQNLASINVPIGVVSIGDSAFFECRELKEVSMPASVTSIGEEAFESCWQAHFTVPYNSYAAYYCRNHDRINYICTHDSPDEPVNPKFGYTVLEDGTICITQCIADPESIEIPSEIDGKKVTRIGNDLFHGCRYLSRVTIPDGVTSIGDRAFYNSVSLKEISFPSSLQSIGEEAFLACERLEAAMIPDDVAKIGAQAFKYCKSLTEVNIPSNMPVLEQNVFAFCDSLTDVVIPEGVEKIEWEAFYDCDDLKTVSIPSSVTQIYDSAFDNCPYVRLIVTANSFAEEHCIKNERIYTYLFGENEEATEPEYTYVKKNDGTIQITGFRGKIQVLSIPSEIDGYAVSSIGMGAFYGRAHLTKVIVPAGVTSIQSRAFKACDNLTLIVIPDSVTEMYEDTFYYCPYLHAAVNPGSYAEGYCNQVGVRYTYISSIQDELDEIYAKTKPEFEYTKLQDGTIRITEYNGEATIVDIPDKLDGLKVTAIGTGVFAEQYNLLSVTIPEGVTSIGGVTFRHCSKLETVSIPKTVTSIGEDAFSGCSNLTVILAYGSYAEEYCLRHNWSYSYIDEPDYDADENGDLAAEDFTYIEQEDGTVCITGCSRLLYDLDVPEEVDGKTVTGIGEKAFAERDSLLTVTIPATVTHIDYRAFYKCENLEIVNFSDGLVEIGEQAFYGSALTDGIVLPDSLETIGEAAFAYSSIPSVYVPGTIVVIDRDVFSWCGSLVYADLGDGTPVISEGMFEGCGLLNDLVLPNSVTRIERDAFSKCYELQNVTLSGSLKSIGPCAFESCTSLQHIELPEGLETIEGAAFMSCTALETVTLPESIVEVKDSAFSSGVRTLIADEKWREYARRNYLEFQPLATDSIDNDGKAIGTDEEGMQNSDVEVFSNNKLTVEVGEQAIAYWLDVNNADSYGITLYLVRDGEEVWLWNGGIEAGFGNQLLIPKDRLIDQDYIVELSAWKDPDTYGADIIYTERVELHFDNPSRDQNRMDDGIRYELYSYLGRYGDELMSSFSNDDWFYDEDIIAPRVYNLDHSVNVTLYDERITNITLKESRYYSLGGAHIGGDYEEQTDKLQQLGWILENDWDRANERMFTDGKGSKLSIYQDFEGNGTVRYIDLYIGNDGYNMISSGNYDTYAKLDGLSLADTVIEADDNSMKDENEIIMDEEEDEAKDIHAQRLAIQEGSREEILNAIGVFDADNLINVSHVQSDMEDNTQKLRIFFDDDVYMGGSEGYWEDWLTASGVVSEAYVDLDGDGTDEYVLIYLVSEEVEESDYSYWSNQWNLAIYESDGEQLKLACEFPFTFSWWGERFVKLIQTERGMRIMVADINYWDGGGGGISTTLYGYDSENAYIDMIMNATVGEDSYIAFGPFNASDEESIVNAMASAGYDQTGLSENGLIEGQNCMFYWYDYDENDEAYIWDEETESEIINPKAFQGFDMIAQEARQFGVKAGYSIEQQEYEDYSYEYYLLKLLGGDTILLWANEDWDESYERSYIDILVHYSNEPIVKLTTFGVENATQNSVLDNGNEGGNEEASDDNQAMVSAEDWFSGYESFVVGKEYEFSTPFAEVFAEWKDDLMEMGIDWGEPSFGLYDMNQDGIPELLVFNGGTCTANEACYVFTYQNGEVVFLGNMSNGFDDLFYIENDTYPGVFSFYGMGGMTWLDYYYISNGSLGTEEILYFDDIGLHIETDGDALLELVSSEVQGRVIGMVPYNEIVDMGWTDYYEYTQQINGYVTVDMPEILS